MIVKGKHIIVPQKLLYGHAVSRGTTDYTILRWSLKTYLYLQSLNLSGIPDILDIYNWNYFPFTPYSHQKETTRFLLENKRAFCWNEAGTGKTASCAWAYDFLRGAQNASESLLSKGDVKKVLVICPLSTTRAVWFPELFHLLPRIPTATLIGSRERRVKLLDKKLDCYIINHDGIKTIKEELIAWMPDLIIVDESTAFKNKSTDRWKALRDIAKKTKRMWLLSGTPAPQAPTDLYGQALFICPESVGRSFRRFQSKVMDQVGMYQWVPKPNFEEIIAAMIQPVIRFKRDDCLDLPDLVKQQYSVDMSKKQELAYVKLRKDALLLIDNKEVTAVNEGVMRTKLLQCCAGYLYDSSDEVRTTVDLLPIHRIDAVRDVIQECARGVIIFAPFRNAISELERQFKVDYEICTITGDTTVKNRAKYIKEFQEGKVKIMLAHPKTMGHGVTLTNADTIIWYLVTSDNELYEQANGRINRIGQKHKMRVIHLVSTPLECKILARLEEKRSMQGVLLETLGEKNER